MVFWELAPRCNRLCWLHEASAEKALEWEHRVETLRIHLRLNSGGKLQASPRTYELFHKGSFLQDPGASYDQVVPQNSNAGEPTKLSGGFLNRTPMTKFIKSGEGHDALRMWAVPVAEKSETNDM